MVFELFLEKSMDFLCYLRFSMVSIGFIVYLYLWCLFRFDLGCLTMIHKLIYIKPWCVDLICLFSST